MKNINILTKITTYCLAGLLFIASPLALAGCAHSPYQGLKQQGGQVIGGIAGAILGSHFGKGDGQLVGIAVGAITGSMIGSHIGADLDAYDRALMRQAAQRAFEYAPDHKPRTWHNPNNGHSGTFQITKTTERKAQHLVCRNFTHTVNLSGRTETIHGRACRDMNDPKAIWRIQ